MNTSHEDIAVAHWGGHCNGGGERVAADLAEAFDAPLFVGQNDPGSSLDAEELFADGLLGKAIARGGLSRMAGYQLGWEIAEPLREFETLVTSGNEPLAYVPPNHQTWVAYVHHTSRWATDLLATALDRDYGRGSRFKRTVEQCVRKGERVMYSQYATKPDLVVVNSEAIARRVHRYWGVPEDKIRVVYPAVDVDDYGPDIRETSDYYLTLSRLDTHKRIDQIVDAFARHPDKRLIVAGDGRERDDLEARAPDNVEVRGYVDELEKRELLSGAKAFIVNALAEDFGITTVEALASGTPVLGVEEGFTQHLVQHGKTGLTYPRGETPLVDAIGRFESGGVTASEADIAAFADRFRFDRFAQEMHGVVAEAHERATVRAEWEREQAEDEDSRVRVRTLTDGGDESWQ